MIPSADGGVVVNKSTSRRRLLLGATGLILASAGAVLLSGVTSNTSNLRTPAVSDATAATKDVLPDAGAEHADEVEQDKSRVVDDESEIKNSDNFDVVKGEEKQVPLFSKVNRLANLSMYCRVLLWQYIILPFVAETGTRIYFLQRCIQ